MSNVINIDGIIFFEPVDFIDFGYEHLDCDSIIIDNNSDSDEIDVICCAASMEYNDALNELYEEKYKDKGCCIMQRISSMEATSID